jgi:hypothetical protein
MFDVIFTCEERCFDSVCEGKLTILFSFPSIPYSVVDLMLRGGKRNRPVHVFNIEIKDTHDDAALGARIILQLAQMVCALPLASYLISLLFPPIPVSIAFRYVHSSSIRFYCLILL